MQQENGAFAAMSRSSLALVGVVTVALGCGAAPDEKASGGSAGHAGADTVVDITAGLGPEAAGVPFAEPVTTLQSPEENMVPPLPFWVEGPFWLTINPNTWSQYALRPASTHMCLLTHVGGRFDGGGEGVQVYNNNGTWFIYGRSAVQASDGNVQAAAYCFKLDMIDANGQDRLISGRFQSFAAEYPYSGCNSIQRDGYAWWGDAATFISGNDGVFDGGGEWGKIIPAQQTEYGFHRAHGELYGPT